MNDLNIELRDNQIIITVPRAWIGSTGLNDRSDANALGTAMSDAVTKFFGAGAGALAGKQSASVDKALSTRGSGDTTGSPAAA
jgi:hypothetical protein